MPEIQDAVAVINGGAREIGLAIAKHRIGHGGMVVLGDVTKEGLKQAKDSLCGEVLTILCDVTSEEDIRLLAASAVESFGKIKLVASFARFVKDGLLVSPDRETGKVLEKMSLEHFQGVVNVNPTSIRRKKQREG